MIAINSATRIMATSLVVVLLAVAVCSAPGQSSDRLTYDSKVRFKAGYTLRFPDFELTYMGKRHVTPPQYPRGWWIHDFR